MKNFKPWRQLTKLLLLNFLAKLLTKKEISNEECNLCEAKISLDEIINSQTNNKFPGNYDLIVEFYKYFSNELAFFFFFSIWDFFHEHSRITGLQGKEEGVSLTLHYHFHPLHRHLGISRAITAESSPLHIASSQTRTGNL